MGCTSSTPTQNPSRSPANGASGVRPIRNQPVTKPNAYRHANPITLAELTRQRQEFWATRVDGSQIMWQGIRSAAEALLADDISLAQAILDASNITTPNGSLELCFDERGHEYKLPVFLLVNPSNLSDNNNNNNSVPAATKTKTETKSESKSVSGSNGGKSVSVKVKINPGDHNLPMITLFSNDSVLDFKKLISEKVIEANIPSLTSCPDSRQRVMFMGRELQNNQTIGDAKMDGSQVVQVFLRPLPK